MANTLKFGNGTWATKKGSTLAYNDENDRYKPLPFTTTRASSATRVNKAGLIETVGSGEPRIDFSNDVKGALLLEPSRTNINTNSESFNTYSLVGGSVISDNLISPSGFLNADSFVEDSNNSQHRIRKDIAVTAGNYTVSCFVKGTDRYLSIYPQSAGVAYSVFDLNNGTITKTGGASYIDSKIENYGNGWYRCILTYSVSTGNSYVHLYLSNISSGTAAEAPTYTGNGSIMNFYGLQIEQGSYATSYIPTSGSAVTRIAEVCNNGGNDQVFNNNTSVWFIDFSRFIYDSSISTRSMVLQDSSGVDQILFWFDHPSDSVRFRDSLNSLAVIGGYISTLANARKKVALKIDGTVLSVFADGVKIGSDYTRPTAFSIGKMDFYGGGTNILDVRYYNTALTDQELIALTQV
jgi:hypothetical protein